MSFGARKQFCGGLHRFAIESQESTRMDDVTRHVVMVKHIESDYITTNWIYEDPDWAIWKKAELEYYDRKKRKKEFKIVIVSI